MIEKQCPECGKLYVCKTLGKRTCSESCQRARFERLNKGRKCKNCYKVFNPKLGDGNFCCKKCRREYKQTVYDNETITCCVVCQKPIPSWRMYCSTSCKNKYNNEQRRQRRILTEEVTRLYNLLRQLHTPSGDDIIICTECGHQWPCGTLQLFEGWVEIK